MEAFAALGLAGNIVQFVDFGCKLFANAQEIYSSASGSSGRVRDAATIVGALNDLCKRLQERPPLAASSSGGLNTSLDLLASECRQVALQLMDLLERIRTREPHSKWSSFKGALKTIIREDEVKALERRLEDYRRQIITTLEVMQRYARHVNPGKRKQIVD